MKLKLDENLGVRGRALLSEAGHDVSTVSLQGMTAASDQEVIQVCQREGRVLVTLDMDFANPMVFRPSHHAGVAVLRLPKEPAAEHILSAVRTLIGGLRARPIAGQLWIVEIGRIREFEESE